MKLNLGCGKYPISGWTNIDIYPFDGVDLIHDLNDGIPFDDNSVEAVVMVNALDHCKNPHFIMDEILRICKPEAYVQIRVPLLQYWQADHYTCFFDDWFERNCGERWTITKKETAIHKNIKDEPYTSLFVQLSPRSKQ